MLLKLSRLSKLITEQQLFFSQTIFSAGDVKCKGSSLCSCDSCFCSSATRKENQEHEDASLTGGIHFMVNLPFTDNDGKSASLTKYSMSEVGYDPGLSQWYKYSHSHQ